MKPKKNPKADLSRKWVLFLQIGFIVVLFLTLQAMQWESEKDDARQTSQIIDDPFIEETPPVTIPEKRTPPPPPPKPIPQVIDIVENNSDKKEEDFMPTDLADIPEVEDIEEPEDTEEPANVPFIAVEDVPVFPGCERLSDNEERKECMSSRINNFVNKNFNTGLAQDLGLTGTNLVIVTFVVNREGEVEQIQARAPHPALAEEAKRVIRELPSMEPGKQRGKAVPVSYSIPIRFKVQD